MASDDVLIVEDDRYTATLLRFLVEGLGLAVRTAEDGREAIGAVAAGDPPNLVLLDLMLPYVNGIHVLERIRREPGWSDVPVMIISARSDEQDIVDAFDAGANDYVVKPFGPDELVARIWRSLRDARITAYKDAPRQGAS